MTIVPDTKDWTWVLSRPCDECGFDSRSMRREDMPALIEANARQWPAILRAAAIRTRPAPDVWSPLEYACHVRDVFVLYDERLRLMLTEDDPLYPNWDQDATAVEARYQEQDPAAVAVELTDAATALAARFAAVAGEQWNRAGTWSGGARFTVDSFARYLLHDPVHHVHDVTGQRAV
jgi:hypothetical protein